MSLARWMQLARAFGGYLFAGVAGLIAAWAVREHIQQRTLELEAQGRVPMVSRVVAAADLPAGASLSVGQLAVRDVPAAWAPSDSVPPDALEQVDGGMLVLPLKAGEPVLRHQVRLQAPPEPVARQLGAGRRALSLPLSEIRDLPQPVRPDDRIDLYVSFSHGGRQLTMPLLQAGKVLAVDAGTDGAPPSITLEASVSDAMKVVAARQDGVLTAMLRPVQDSGGMEQGRAQDLPGMLGLRQPAPARSREIRIIYGDRLEGASVSLPAGADVPGEAP
ncbi:secretory protein [Bordetella ansorpii]|uniref:Secretory protein n=1 Tax=Bordetella ansorpii TaxID=288768 RepID=A0A157RFT7_9BORD|nr:Flp pilus assembly protein CpaB [Bordetella ansorpii]SAI56851.1 secretory protein [Bordetella ansorpii]